MDALRSRQVREERGEAVKVVSAAPGNAAVSAAVKVAVSAVQNVRA